MVMKTIGTFAVVVTASIALLQPAEGRSYGGGGRSFSSGSHFSSGGHYSGGGYSRASSYSRSAPRYYSGSSPRYSATTTARSRVYAQSNSTRRYSSQAAYQGRQASQSRLSTTRRTALNPDIPRNFNPRLNSQVAANRANIRSPQTFANTRVIGQHTAAQHPNWNRNHDHNWNGHRCHWHNNHWVIYGLGYYPFYPWGYGYGYGYPYSSYYDDGYYDEGYAANDYSQQNGYDANSSVSQVQEALAREGFYHGAIDGSVGPATRNALRQFQIRHGLEVTGQIDGQVLQALRLR